MNDEDSEMVIGLKSRSLPFRFEFVDEFCHIYKRCVHANINQIPLNEKSKKFIVLVETSKKSRKFRKPIYYILFMYVP